MCAVCKPCGIIKGKLADKQQDKLGPKKTKHQFLVLGIIACYW